MAHYDPARPQIASQPTELWRFIEEHPLKPMLFQQPAKAWKLSDVISHRVFLNTGFYRTLYRSLGVDFELAAVSQEGNTPGAFLLICLHRHRHDFNERDRVVMNLLLPHIANAHGRLNGARQQDANGQPPSWREESDFCVWLREHTPWRLTRRESDVLFWLCQGKTNAEIGRILGMAERTAETHALRLYPKMGVENRYTAMATLNRLASMEWRPPDSSSSNGHTACSRTENSR